MQFRRNQFALDSCKAQTRLPQVPQVQELPWVAVGAVAVELQELEMIQLESPQSKPYEKRDCMATDMLETHQESTLASRSDIPSYNYMELA
jgi:hypothetical protein